jgi:hypothetical protein
MNLYCRSVINDSDTSPLIIHTNNHDGDCFIIKYIGSFIERSDNVVDSGHYTVPSGYIRFRYISPENPITIMFDSEHFISFEQIINESIHILKINSSHSYYLEFYDTDDIWKSYDSDHISIDQDLLMKLIINYGQTTHKIIFETYRCDVPTQMIEQYVESDQLIEDYIQNLIDIVVEELTE